MSCECKPATAVCHERSSVWTDLQGYDDLMDLHPVHLDLQRDRGLAIEWSDGTRSFYPVAHLRRLSPSAESRHLRAEMARNPLTVLPASAVGSSGAAAPLTAVDAELVGNYAVRIHFSDGHHTGIYSWAYLREIDPAHETRGT